MDNIQPMMLNDATGGKAWMEHGVKLAQIMGRNKVTPDGSKILWDYARQEIIEANVEKGTIKKE